MDDENEEEGIGRLDAVQYQHRLHCEMPRTSTIRGWHDDGDASHDEGYKPTHKV